MAKFPEQTLGIVAINRPQAEEIEKELSILRDTDQIVSDYYDKWDHQKIYRPIIRNLENIQGDERDIIIISTVYGKDEEGNMYQRFPLINTITGYRRLNVLFTRAISQLILITSMDPS